jgi:Fe2+ or Zn2+ uptake regulation protein
MVANSTIFASILKGNGYSTTRPRTAVFESLAAQGSMTMAELAQSVKDVCDRASVYRTVELFEKLNIAQRVAMGWKYRIELSDIFQGHHHHAICISCDRVIDFTESPAIESALQQISTEIGFTVTDHSLEVQGYCDRCRQQTNK